MQNYHKHSCQSNVFITDSIATYDDYAKRCLELGHKVLSSVEHGWQGNYYVPYGVAKKYGLKFIFGTEAYWVKNRLKKDRSNHHIIILARTELGRQSINDILAEASITGYYFRPRVDLELLLSLPPQDVFITTACLAFWDEEDIEEIVVKLHNHFSDNFML
jgi:DNA polymerase III alpha subunit